MDTEFLRSFLVIAEKKSLSVAAEELNISPSALSSSLHKLEEEMGYRFFERSSKGLTLTDRGAYFLEWAKNNVYLEDRIRETLNRSLKKEGTIKIGVKVESDTMFILLSAFRRENPGIRIELYGENSVPHNYLSSDLDMFVIPESERRGLPGIRLANRNSIFVLMREDHPLAGKEVITFEDLHDQRFVYSSYEGKLEWMYEYCCMHGLDPDVQYLCDDYDGKLSVITGANVLAFSYNTMRLLRENMHGIKAIPLQADREIREEFYLVWRDEPLNPLADTLVKFAKEFDRLGREAFMKKMKM